MKRERKERDRDVRAKEYWVTQRTLSALASVASALQERRGAGFFLSGPTGSEHGRLLAAMHELSETRGALPQLRAEQGVPGAADRQQVDFVEQVFQTCRIAPCYVYLGRANRALSAELLEAVKQQHLWVGPEEADLSTSLDVVDGSLVGSNRDMLLLLVDELEPFLGRKAPSEALQDMRFLRRLGEGLPDHRVVIVLAVRKSIDVLGDMRYGELEKFRERYRVLPLHVDGALAQRYSAQPRDDDLVTAERPRYLRETPGSPASYEICDALAMEPDIASEFEEMLEPAESELDERKLGSPPSAEAEETPEWLVEFPPEPDVTSEAEELPDWLPALPPRPEALSEPHPAPPPDDVEAQVRPCGLPVYEREQPPVVHELHSEVLFSSEPPAIAIDPVRRLASILMQYCDPDDLDSFLESKGILEGGLEARVVELCAMEDPVSVLVGLFTEPRLRKLAKELGLHTRPASEAEELCTAILVALGFATPRAPTGISTHRRRLVQLRSALQWKNERAAIIGVGSEGCDDVGDQVLRDIIAFYCTVLLGDDYEQALGREGLVPGEGRPSLDGLTFGHKIGVLERLDGYLQRHPEAKDLMRRWFDRTWVVKNSTHLQKYLSRISPYRNHLAHPQGIDTPTLKHEADEALRLLTELFEQFEKERVYPPVIAVDAVQIDRYGRRMFLCVDDRGCEERLFTDVELEIGREYFFYPVTNPIRVDPLIVPKHSRPPEKPIA